MIPLRDDVPTRIPPVVVVALIVANAGLFLVQATLVASAGGDALERFVHAWGLVPRDILRAAGDPGALGARVWATPFSSMFLHAGWAHLIGNMLYLWIFGNNVEDLLGHGRFALFYLVCGLAASAAHVANVPGSHVPTVGASGAVSGLLGAYLLSYPTARVRTLVPLGFVWTTVAVPAGVFLVLWFALQILSGLASLGGEGAGVAWWAHIGGFAVGVVLIRPMRVRAPTRARLGV